MSAPAFFKLNRSSLQLNNFKLLIEQFSELVTQCAIALAAGGFTDGF
jgi:hypothetical protein